MNWIALSGLMAVNVVLAVPTMALNAAGLGFRKKYRIGGRDVVRPRHFDTKAHKAAFEDVGDYITNALTRDAMISYQDDALSDGSFLRPKNVPLPVWQEVLAFFAAEGCIEGYWQLRLPRCLKKPDYYRYLGPNAQGWNPYDRYQLRTPQHGPGGEPLTANKESAFSGEIRDPNNYSPGMLTDEQKQALLGKPYPLYPSNYEPRRGEDVTEAVVVEERHFSRLYYRNRAVLSEKDFRRGAKRFLTVAAMAGSGRK
jgi:hypothetical protein